MRYVLLVLIALFVVFNLTLVFTLIVCIRRADEIERRILLQRVADRQFAPQHTVRWIRQGNVECAYKGVLIPLDADTLVIEGVDGPVVVNRVDIVEVL